MSEEPSEKAVFAFSRAYVFCAWLTSFFTLTCAVGSLTSPGGSIFISLGMVLLVMMIVLPMIWKGGIGANLRWAIVTAIVVAVGFSFMLIAAYMEFVETGGAEGPRGEGSPLAIILAMAMFAALFQGPWLLTALRGMRVWRR